MFILTQFWLPLLSVEGKIEEISIFVFRLKRLQSVYYIKLPVSRFVSLVANGTITSHSLFKRRILALQTVPPSNAGGELKLSLSELPSVQTVS